MFYRLLTAKFVTGHELTTEELGVNWHCRCVETLPEVGVVCTDAQMTFVDVYYSVADNAIYGYVDDELAQLFNTSSGWQSMEVLCMIADITWGGIITTKEEDSNDGSLYILLAYEFYTYQDGWTKLIMSQEKQPEFDIRWDGNIDGKFVLDMAPLGFDYTYFVKVSDQVFTVDELVGSQFMQTSGDIFDIDTSNIDSESYPGALSLNDGVVICYDASTLNAVLGLPEGYITNGTYFVYIQDASGYIMYTHRLVGRAGITKIDSKYIDATDILEDVNNTFDRLHSVAWTGDYNMLNNKPTIYTDVVRYDTVQNFSSSQKEIARNNIDVYSKSEVTTMLSNYAPDEHTHYEYAAFEHSHKEIIDLEDRINVLVGDYSRGLLYRLNEDTTSYMVSGIGTCTDTDIVIPKQYNSKPVTSIGYGAFSDCTSLTSVEIPDSVTSIGIRAFYNCTSLAGVVIGDSVTSIGGSVFRYCTSLTSIVIPNSVTSISDFAFADCTSLTNVVIGDLVTSIEKYAFNRCSGLTKIIIPTNVTSIGEYAFAGCSSLTDVYHAGSQEQWDALNIIDGNYALLNATIHYNYANDFISVNEKLDALVGGYSRGLKYVLNEDETSYSVSVGTCTDKDVVISSKYDGKPVTRISNGAFQSCTSLTSIIIPDSVTSIGNSAFSGCTSLTSIVIPDSVTSIGESAFYGCTSLADVYYTGTQEQWENITIGSGNESLTNATVHYNFANDFVSVNDAINEISDKAIKKDSYGVVSLKGNYPLSLSKGTEESPRACFINSPTLTERNIDLYIQPKSGTIALTDDLSNLATVNKIHYIDTQYSGVSAVSIKSDGIHYDVDSQIQGEKFSNMADIGFKGTIPIMAGENVTFEVDEENQVVKINATGGGATEMVSKIGTWTVIDNPEIPTTGLPLKFTSNGEDFIAIGFGTVGPDSWGIRNLAYTIDEEGQYTGVYTNNPSGNYGITHGWDNQGYKQITVTEEPTDANTIAWLENNTDAPKAPVSDSELPKHTAEDEGKFLRIVNGAPAWAVVPNAEDYSF